ncbi:MAG: DUF86 domain-containing protein [Nitrospiraceae bacterium]|nr:DUF86 domain-containing protein [Nitrospiraceae bacterium]
MDYKLPRHQFWLRWSDALKEAGCQTNSFTPAFPIDFLITKYIELIRELGRFPIEGELDIKGRSDKDFPNRMTFSKRLGSKPERAAKILNFCKEHNEIIGEATKNIPDAVREKYKDIPWRDMAGMRDKVSHFYFGINFNKVWLAVKKNFPIPKPRMKQVLADLGGTTPHGG